MALVLLAAMLVGMPTSAASAVANGGVLFSPNLTTYPQGDASYPRLIRIVNDGTPNDTLLATFAKRFQGAPTNLPIYRSTNGGTSWSVVSTITSNTAGWDLEAPVLYEVPYTAGGLNAGDILAAGTAWAVDNYTAQKVEVFRSTDKGSTWSYLSNCAATSGEPNTWGHGIWEPWFLQKSDGTLGCFISDERPSGGATNNQIIGHYTSTNGGVTWSGSITQDVAFPADNLARPGMQTIVKLPNGTFMMSYEMCRDATDPDHACQVYVKTSSDGLNWGTASNAGTLVQTADGRQLLHTPYISWSPAGGPNGTVLISGQRVVTGTTGSFAVKAESGKVVFANTNLGVGAWDELTAPISVDPTGSYGAGMPACPGYSSPLLPTEDGRQILYLAGSWLGVGKQCEIRIGSSTLGAGDPPAPTFVSGTKTGFAEYGGTWSTGTGTLSQTASVAGSKALFGSTAWADYVFEADVRLDSSGQAGLLTRVSNPSIGADAHSGYYIGLESVTGNLVFGRQNNGWTGLAATAATGGVVAGVWYHLTVAVEGCAFKITSQPDDLSSAATTITQTVSGCQTTGMAGLRSHFTSATWRDVAVAPNGFTEYGGAWQSTVGLVKVTTSVAGSKAMFGSASWTDYAVEADVRLDGSGQAGLLTRTINPAVGADAHSGYYVGIESSTGTLVFGRQNNNWTTLASVAATGGISANVWYRVRVAVKGCAFTITSRPADLSAAATTISQTVTGCQAAGAPGLRSHFTTASWRNVVVSTAP